MNIVAHNHQSRELLSSKISRFFEEFHVGRILKACNAYKVRGFSVKEVFQVAFENAFSSKSFFQKQRESSTSIPFAKDTFYRFMNSSSINWRKFTLQLSSAVIQKIEPLTNEKRRNVLIIDDSLFSRARAKKVELLAKVYDHVEHKYTKGFRMLTLGWSDGNSFLPLSQCLLSSAERENRLQEASSDIDARSNGGKLRKLAQTKATSVMLTLLKEAKTLIFRQSMSSLTHGSVLRMQCCRLRILVTMSLEWSKRVIKFIFDTMAGCKVHQLFSVHPRSVAAVPHIFFPWKRRL